MELITLVAFAFGFGGVLAAVHYIWREKELQAPWTYLIGVGTVQGAVISWMLVWQVEPLTIWAIVITTTIVGGLNLLCHLIDWIHRLQRKAADGQSRRTDLSR